MESEVLARVRQGALGLVGLGSVGVCADLVLLGHYGDASQAIPLAVCATGGLVALLAMRVPRPGMLRTLQFVMLLYAGSAIIGVTLHRERAGTRLREDPVATVPPLLSPASLLHLGLLGLLATYRHPQLE